MIPSSGINIKHALTPTLKEDYNIWKSVNKMYKEFTPETFDKNVTEIYTQYHQLGACWGYWEPRTRNSDMGRDAHCLAKLVKLQRLVSLRVFGTECRCY